MNWSNGCQVHQCQETFLRDVEIWTNKLQFCHKNMQTEKYIWIEVCMHSEFCVIYNIMGFVISGYEGIEQYEQKWRFWKMNWKILLHAFMILDGETNEAKRTYRKAECCKECQSKECLHCRCCQKMKNWRQIHMGPIYTQTFVTVIEIFYLRNPTLEINMTLMHHV